MGIMDAVARWYDANNAGSIDAVMATLVPGGTFQDPVTRGPIADDKLHALLKTTVEQFPDCHYRVDSAGATSDRGAAAQWTMTATHADTGRTVVLEGADFFTYDPEADRFSTVVGYFDQSQLRKQLRG
jgi:steroid delta-isomerase-like uncharacterized protein